MSTTNSFAYIDSMLYLTEEGTDSPAWRHLHWGLYDDPATDDDSPAGYYAAAEAMTEHILEVAGVADGRHVLDVGCGLGGTLDHIRSRNRGCRLVGLNIDERQVQRARTLLDGHRVAFVTADGCRLPVADRTVDHVLAIECIFHFPSRKRFFREAARVLRPGGTLGLSDFLVAPGALAKVLAKAVSRGAAEPPEPPSRPVPGAAAGATELASVAAEALEAAGVTGEGWYGPTARPLTSSGYERLGRGTGFELIVDEDVTARTLPTYPAIHGLYAATKADGLLYDEEASLAGLASSDDMEELARSGDLGYHVLAFRRRDT